MNAVASTVVKFAAIGRITVRNHLAYVTDFLLRTVFLVVILYIFMQLWGATYQGEGGGDVTIAGYRFEQMIWYLIFTESLSMAFPSLPQRIEEEVKSGDVGYKLTRPISYIGLHYTQYIGEAALRCLINLAVGSLLGILVLGLPQFGFGWVGFLFVAVGSVTVNFLLTMIVALCAFWVEETRGLEFVYNKILFTIGGMLMPLEIFPELLQAICKWLPFQTVLYFAAKTAVKYEPWTMLQMIGIQWMWIVVLGLVVTAMYRKGVKKLNVNGG